MSPRILLCLTLGATALSFALLAFVLLRAFASGAGSYAEQVSDTASRQLEDLFLFIPPRRITEAGWACALAAFLLFALLLFNPRQPAMTAIGLAAGTVAAVAAFQIPSRILLILKDRRRRRFNEQLVEALGQISNALKAGFSITQAFETVVANGENPIAQEFEVFLQQMRVGISFSDALQNLERRVGSEDLELVCSAMEIARRTGGNLTEIFEKISLTIRERMRIERRVQTLTAQGRLQGIIVACMPALLGAVMTFIKPGMMIPFFKSVNGMIAIGLTALLIAVGWFFISRIIRIDV